MRKYGLNAQQAKAIVDENTLHHFQNVRIQDGKIIGEARFVDPEIHTNFRHSGGVDLWRKARALLGLSTEGYGRKDS
jgi:hypothetical protein